MMTLCGRCSALPDVLRIRRNYAEAESLNRLCLDARRRKSGPDDPATLTAMNDLAMVLQNRDKLDEAETLFRRHGRRGPRRVQGPEHLHTLFSIDNLARLLQARGKLGRSRRPSAAATSRHAFASKDPTTSTH